MAQTIPINFPSFDLNMGLTHAAQGKEVSGITRAVLYCFFHQPPGQGKFFGFLAVGGSSRWWPWPLFSLLRVTRGGIRSG